MKFSAETKLKIRDAILNECEGIQYQEFDIDKLDTMIANIETIVEDANEELRREPSRPVIVSTGPKVRAKAPKVGSHIDVYARELQRSVSMEVFDRRENTLFCGFEGIEYTVRLQSVGGNDYRWEGECG